MSDDNELSCIEESIFYPIEGAATMNMVAEQPYDRGFYEGSRGLPVTLYAEQGNQNDYERGRHDGVEARMIYERQQITVEADAQPPERETQQERPWQQINATVYQLVLNGQGELVNRFSFNVQGNNRTLKPGEDEQIALQIIREHNSHAKLVAVLRDELEAIRIWQSARGVPTDVRDGLQISAAKIQTALALAAND